jgi:hypothetical protein
VLLRRRHDGGFPLLFARSVLLHHSENGRICASICHRGRFLFRQLSPCARHGTGDSPAPASATLPRASACPSDDGERLCTRRPPRNFPIAPTEPSPRLPQLGSVQAVDYATAQLRGCSAHCAARGSAIAYLLCDLGGLTRLKRLQLRWFTPKQTAPAPFWGFTPKQTVPAHSGVGSGARRESVTKGNGS